MADGQDRRGFAQVQLRRQRACLPCSRAKAKCDFRDDNDPSSKCDRCYRMKIDCLPQTSKVLRRPRLKSSTRVLSLEKRLDNLTSLLEAGSINARSYVDSNPNSHDSSSAEVTPPPFPHTDHGESDYLQPALFDDYLQGAHQVTATYPLLQDASRDFDQPKANYSSMAPASPGFGLTWKQADQAISNFKLNYMPVFPFVPIGPAVFAHELYCEKPLLFRVVVLVAAPLVLSKQKEIKRSINAYIGQHLLVLEERQLDLLQGLLVFIAWGNHDFYRDRQITMLLYLAVGYAHSLGITRTPVACSAEVTDAFHPVETDTRRHSSAVAAFLRSLEEKRAFLGVYYLLSANSAQFRRTNALKSTHIEHCLEGVGRAAEYWTDSNLEKMVRLQQIVEGLSETFPVLRDPDRIKNFGYLITGEMKPLRDQVDKIIESFTRDQFACSAHYNHTLVRLYEPAIWLSPPPGEDSFYRCQCLLYCLQAAKSFFNSVLSLSTEGFLVRTYVSSAEALAVLVTTSRLLFLEVDGWDRAAARRTIDLPATIERFIAAANSASVLRRQRAAESGGSREDPTVAAAAVGGGGAVGAEDPDGDDTFAHIARKLAWIKMWFESRVAAEAAGLPSMSPDVFWSTPSDDSDAGANQFWSGLMENQSWEFEF